MNTQKQLVDFLSLHPMKTEKEICAELWKSSRDKKHADLIRRALFNDKIARVKSRISGRGKGRALFYYFTKLNSINMNTAEIKRENFINLYNEKGEKHGVWEDYYGNGKLSYRVNFVNGKEHGAWESYYENGQLSYRGNFVDGKQHGLLESYWSNGELCYRKEYNMGKEVQPIIELTRDEIAEKFGVPVGQLKIKK